MATTFEWNGDGNGRYGVQIIDGKEIQHPKMWANLEADRKANKQSKLHNAIISGRKTWEEEVKHRKVNRRRNEK